MKKFFGTDGIRGIAGKHPLIPDFVKKIGAAAANIISQDIGNNAEKEIVLGCDTRESSRWIVEKLAEGITAAGINIVDLGVISTPAVSYIASVRNAMAGCVVSASHNPAEFNGIKFFSNTGTKIPDSMEEEIEKLLLDDNFSAGAGSSAETINSKANLVKSYSDFVVNTVMKGGDLSGVKVALDCANGANSVIAPSVFAALKAELTVLSAAPNGKNINKNCGSLHMQNLTAAVKETNADFGIAYDGDADRCLFVDETGEIRDGDYLIAIAAIYFKNKGLLKNNAVVATVMANLGFFKAMDNSGINVYKSGVGDKYVYEELKKAGAILGGEQSGHIIFRDYMNTGDGLLTSLVIAQIIKTTGRTLSELSAVLKKYPQVLLNVAVKNKIPVEDSPATAAAIKTAEEKMKDNGRILVRYSGTEPLLRIMVEGPEENMINEIARSIAATIVF